MAFLQFVTSYSLAVWIYCKYRKDKKQGVDPKIFCRYAKYAYGKGQRTTAEAGRDDNPGSPKHPRYR
jgi:hypothetical protein